MSDAHKSTRLGDLLVARGSITPVQLKAAIDLQQSRRLHEIQAGVSTTEKKELGEILIELGYINRYQLNSGLGWQHKLRRTTFAMAFVAPLLTAACGGGGGGSSSPNETVHTQTVSSQSVNPQKPEGQASSSATSLSSVSSTTSSIATSSARSSTPASSSSSSVSSAAVSSVSSAPASASSSSATSSQAAVDGPVVIYWSVPTQRENGDRLDITEIGGYELRYKLKTSADYTTVDIDSGFTDTYYFDYLQGDYEFELATYDTDGLYSAFVKMIPQ